MRTASMFVTVEPLVGFFLLITTGFQSCSKPDILLRLELG
jgi:hypothetical protein